MMEEITKTLGVKLIADALKLQPSAVSNAKKAGRFPASWFNAIEQLCTLHNIKCPRELFNWRGEAEIAPLERVSTKTKHLANTHGTAA